MLNWRDQKKTAERGYDSRWQRASRLFLKANPLCKLCADVGHTTTATLVDHIVPHRGSETLFWDEKNWQPCCVSCHNTVKQRQEKSGIVIGCSPDGIPLDPNHHWNKKAD